MPSRCGGGGSARSGTGLPGKSPAPSAGEELVAHIVRSSNILRRSLNDSDSAPDAGLKPLNGAHGESAPAPPKISTHAKNKPPVSKRLQSAQIRLSHLVISAPSHRTIKRIYATIYAPGVDEQSKAKYTIYGSKVMPNQPIVLLSVGVRKDCFDLYCSHNLNPGALRRAE